MVTNRFPEETYLSVAVDNMSSHLVDDFNFDELGRKEQARVWDNFQQNRPNAFDGKLVRLRSFIATGDAASVTVQGTSFSAYISSRHPSFLENFPDSERADPLGLTVLLLSADDHLIITQRSLTAEQNPGGLYFVGGYAEPALQNGEIDLFAEACREVEEELGLANADPAKSRLIGLAYDPVYCHPELFFIVKSQATAEQILQAYNNADDRHEAHRVFSAPFDVVLKDEIEEIASQPKTWSYIKGINFARAYVQSRTPL